MSKPLAGISIGASYLAADVEAQIRDKVRGMGGEFHHQLCPTTDFLITGKRWTEKYNYAVQHEIVLISQEAFFASHTQWVQGEEVDLRQFLTDNKLQAFENMLLTITNMDNDQRNGFQKFLEASGADYVPSLNQRVSVLVSPLDEGKKVNGARKWQIPVVAPKWMTDSGKLGAALDPHNYDPGNPRATMEPPIIFPKRPSNADTSDLSNISGDTASTADTSTGDTSVSSVTSTSRLVLKRKMAPSGLLAKRLPTSVGATFIKPPVGLDSVSEKRTDRLFSAINFTFVGFTDRESGILSHTVRSLGGNIEHERPDYIIVNSVKPEMPSQLNGAKIITEWALERSLFHKEVMLDSQWGTPVYSQPCKGFDELRICISGFTEIDQRHVTLLIKLLGGKFMETLTADRDLLVAGSAQAHKVRYAKNWGVPVVSSDWLWQCAQAKNILPIAVEHSLDGLSFRAAPRRKEPAAANPTEATNSATNSSHASTSSSPWSSASTHATASASTKNIQLQIGRMVASGTRYSSKQDNETLSGTTTASSNSDTTEAEPKHSEVRYEDDDDAAKQAQILLAMGERPPTPPPAEPKVPSMRSAIYSRARRNRA